jgi:1,4-dihydroxy-2-naphthoate octaprenyltransferase
VQLAISEETIENLQDTIKAQDEKMRTIQGTVAVRDRTIQESKRPSTPNRRPLLFEIR